MATHFHTNTSYHMVKSLNREKASKADCPGSRCPQKTYGNNDRRGGVPSSFSKKPPREKEGFTKRNQQEHNKTQTKEDKKESP